MRSSSSGHCVNQRRADELGAKTADLHAGIAIGDREPFGERHRGVFCHRVLGGL